MAKITSPVTNTEIPSGYFTVTGEIDDATEVVDGYAWLVMGRTHYHHVMWPKANVSGNFSESIFEGGDPGPIICRLMVVTPSVHERFMDVSVTDAGLEIPDFVQLDYVNLTKTGDLAPKP
jgi:hypothetical protein